MAEQMKPSGITWIGDIPQNWKLSRLKYNITCLDERRVPVDATLRNPGPYPYWGAGSIVDYVDDYLFDEELVLLGEDGAPFFDEYRPVAFFITKKIWANNHIHVIKGKHGVCNRFLVHYLNSVEYREYINGSILNKLTQGNMNEIACPIPPTEEQEVIANFLDAQCAKIDGIIADIEKQIETIQKYKKSLITETVTKGLDKSVPMKDSGLEWIGKVPIKWDVSRVKYLTDINHPYPIGDGDHGMIKADDYLDEGIPYIRVLNLTWGDGLNLENLVFISDEMNSMIKNSELKPNDILIAKTGATIGKTAIVPEYLPISNTTSHVGKITLPDTQCAKYFFYVMTSNIIQKQIQDISSMQSTRPELGIEGMKNLVVVVPPLKMQQNIAAYLDERCNQIDVILQTKKAQLDICKKHKKSLIYEYVTGKKRVTEVN